MQPSRGHDTDPTSSIPLDCSRHFSPVSLYSRAASCILFPNHTPRSTAAEWRSPTASELKYYEFTKWGWATKGRWPSLMRKIDVTSSYLGRLTRSDDRRGIVSRCRLHCGRIARSYESTSDEYLRALAPSRAPRDFREGNTNGPGGKRVRSNQTTPRVPSASIHLDTLHIPTIDLLLSSIHSLNDFRFCRCSISFPPTTPYRVSHVRVRRLPRETLKCPTCVYGCPRHFRTLAPAHLRNDRILCRGTAGSTLGTPFETVERRSVETRRGINFVKLSTTSVNSIKFNPSERY